MSMLSRVFAYAAAAMVGGAALGAVSAMNEDVQKRSCTHDDFRTLEDYNPELTSIFLRVSSTAAFKHPHTFYALHKAIVRLLTLSKYLDDLMGHQRDWATVATRCVSDAHLHVNVLLAHAHEFEQNEATQLREDLDVIKKVADAVNTDLVRSFMQHRGDQRDGGVLAYPVQ